MATSVEYIEYVCEQIRHAGQIRYKKMFGEYMIYVDEKPILLVCDNTVFVKKVDTMSILMQNADTDYPYDGAKPHYILDIENEELTKQVIGELLRTCPLPKTKKH